MEEREGRAFSLPALLLVTGFCFLSFAQVIKILDGIHTQFFLVTGLTSFVLGVLTGVCILIDKKQKSHQDTGA